MRAGLRSIVFIVGCRGAVERRRQCSMTYLGDGLCTFGSGGRSLVSAHSILFYVFIRLSFNYYF